MLVKTVNFFIVDENLPKSIYNENKSLSTASKLIAQKFYTKVGRTKLKKV